MDPNDKDAVLDTEMVGDRLTEGVVEMDAVHELERVVVADGDTGDGVAVFVVDGDALGDREEVEDSDSVGVTDGVLDVDRDGVTLMVAVPVGVGDTGDTVAVLDAVLDIDAVAEIEAVGDTGEAVGVALEPQFTGIAADADTVGMLAFTVLKVWKPTLYDPATGLAFVFNEAANDEVAPLAITMSQRLPTVNTVDSDVPNCPLPCLTILPSMCSSYQPDPNPQQMPSFAES